MVESYVQVPADSAGKKLRTIQNVVGLNTVESEVMVLEDGSGNLLIPMNEGGTLKIASGTIGVSMGTLQTVTNINSLTQIGTLPTLGTMGTVYYVATVGQIGTAYLGGAGTVKISDGTLTALPNIVVGSGTIQTLSRGSLQYVGNIGTLPNIVVGSGTLQAVTSITNAVTIGSGTLQMLNAGTITTVSNCYLAGIGTVAISSGTLTGSNPSAGTLDTITRIGTLPNVTIAGGTVNITGALTGANPTDGTLTQLGTMYYLAGLGMGTVVIASGTLTGSNPSAGTLDTLTRIGTLPNIIVGSGTLQAVTAITNAITVGSGTLQMLNGGTVNTVLAAYLAGAGTLQTVTQIGTLPNVVIGSGTLQQVTNAYLAGAGTLRTVTQIGTLPNVVVGSGTLQTLSAGSLQYIGNIGTLPNVIVGSGTLQSCGTLYGLTQGTLNTVGSATVYSKHDLHVYDSVGTQLTATTGQGSLVQTASKIVKVHQYRAQADGSFGFHFADTKPNGGTIDQGWYFQQREGITTPFVAYPAYLFKTSTAGSALVVGTWPSIPCNGTLRLQVVYTDDDAT